MKAALLVRTGEAKRAFEYRDIPDPFPGAGQVRVAVEFSGLNFADVLARLGLYRDLPPLPVVLGYEVVGRIDRIGPGVERLREGMRVVGMTRFGGYAALALCEEHASVQIPDDYDGVAATALATQYVTAWYAAEELVHLFEGDQVLIQSASGGMGNALVQIARRDGCRVIGATSSAHKLEELRRRGVDVPLLVTPENYEREVRGVLRGGGLDVIFDPIGGPFFRQGLRLLRGGGRIVCLGVSDMAVRRPNLLRSLRSLLALGFVHPAMLMLHSKAVLGVNMLRVGEDRPDVIARCLNQVVARAIAGEFRPVVGATYPVDRLDEAHEALASKQTSGKTALRW
jgi:synaptic vesicle membrane protein VAT-1